MKPHARIPALLCGLLVTSVLAWSGPEFQVPETAFPIPEGGDENLPPLRMCYFSLNNEKEFTEMTAFVSKIQRRIPRKIVVEELRDPGAVSSADESFKNMVSSGKACDGLVISGHNTGFSYAGKRARGAGLTLAGIEKLSCDPKYSGFFDNVQALWLQGCRSLGVGAIEPMDEERSDVSADFHMFRVAAVLEEDQLDQSMETLARGFTAILDQDNPLSARMSAAFPRATLMGWSKTAPGERSASQYSIPYHIAHTAKFLNDAQSGEQKLYQDPCKSGAFGEKVGLCYANTLVDMLDRANSGVDESKLCAAITQGWISHGNPQPGEYGFANPDIQSHKPLTMRSDPELVQAKRDACTLMKRDLGAKETLKTVDSMLKNRKTIGYSFNSLVELVGRLKASKNPDDRKLFESVQKRLMGNAELQEFIQAKLASPQVSLIRKMDYYAFYKLFSDRSLPNVDALMLKTAKAQLAQKPKKASDARTFRQYKQVLAHSLFANGFPVSQEWVDEVVKNGDSDALMSVTAALNETQPKAIDVGSTLERIAKRPQADATTLRYLAYFVASGKMKEGRGDALLIQALRHDKADASVATAVVDAIGAPAARVSDTQAVLNAVLSAPLLNEQALVRMATSIAQAKSTPEQTARLYESLVSNPHAGATALRAVLLKLPASNADPEDVKRLIKRIQAHPRVDASVKREIDRFEPLHR